MGLTKAEQEELELLELEEQEAQFLNDQRQSESGLKTFARVATKSLPMAGSVAGGVIAGGPTLGAGALTGSALGAMAGRAAQTLIEENFLDEPEKTLEEKFLELPKEAVYDVAGNITGAKVVGPAVGLLSKPLTKLASSMSGVPDKAIETYAKNINEVNAIDDIALEADRIRQSASAAIENFKKTQNRQISKSIAERAEIPVDTTGAIKYLEQMASQKNSKINPDVILDIEKQKNVLESISSFDPVTGKYSAPAKDAAEMKQKLQDLAQYEEVGRTFAKKDYTGLSMAGAARELRRDVNKAIPEYAQANLELAKLRRMEGKFNKNLITPEKPFNAMVSVGSGQNPMMEKQVEKLGQIVDQDLLSPMQNLASAQKLGSADYISGLTTGRASLPFLLGGLAGSQFGAPIGVAAGALSTPIGIKSAIGTGKAMQKIGLTPARIGSESVQAMMPELYTQAKETLTQKAERINQERKLIKGQ